MYKVDNKEAPFVLFMSLKNSFIITCTEIY